MAVTFIFSENGLGRKWGESRILFSPSMYSPSPPFSLDRGGEDKGKVSKNGHISV